MADKKTLGSTDRKLRQEATKTKAPDLIKAVFIGFLVGIIVISIFITVSSSGKERYYKGPNGKVYTEADYLKIKSDLEKTNKVDVQILRIQSIQDSVIHHFKLSIEPLDKTGKKSDPYTEHYKKIGQQFPIEKFSALSGKAYTNKYLTGKPTVVNFWFTSCIPCMDEIPKLNLLQQKFGDKANFVAITFDSADKVAAFTKKRPIHFKHITGAKAALKEMNVEAYPMTMLLDSDGKIVKVYGDISGDDTISEDLLKLLKNK